MQAGDMEATVGWEWPATIKVGSISSDPQHLNPWAPCHLEVLMVCLILGGRGICAEEYWLHCEISRQAMLFVERFCKVGL